LAFVLVVSLTFAMLAILPTLALGSFEAIYNYIPNSKVTPHNAIDLDQAQIETALGLTTVDYTTAKNMYQSGGHSKSYAAVSVASAAANIPAFTTAAACSGTDASGNAVTGMSLKSAASAATSGNAAGPYKCIYPTSTTQATFCTCMVGAIPSASQVTTGCLDTSATLTITEGSNTVTLAGGTYTISNDAGRTIQGFGTSSTHTSKMYTNSASCPGCPYRDYVKFYNFYGAHGYGDDIVLGALNDAALATEETEVVFPSTPLAPYTKVYNFTLFSDDNTRTQVIKKTTAYMNVWMYTVREFEDAIDDCEVGNTANNDGSVHAWDEGVAFYTGSLEGTDGSGSGKLIAALADKRCQNFGTCGAAGDAITGTSKVNHDLLHQFQLGRNELIVLNCAGVRPILNRIVSLMTIPLVQGTLRYAYRMGAYGPAGAGTATASTMLTYNAEGVVFAGAVLPLVAACSSGAAQTIRPTCSSVRAARRPSRAALSRPLSRPTTRASASPAQTLARSTRAAASRAPMRAPGACPARTPRRAPPPTSPTSASPATSRAPSSPTTTRSTSTRRRWRRSSPSAPPRG
jgi:hypothetical protein